MMDSRSDSVVLPLVARKVQSLDTALNASNSEGADFLIYSVSDGSHVDSMPNSVRDDVKIPIFVRFPIYGEDMLAKEASKCLKSGASGLVISVKDFEKYGENVLSTLFDEVDPPSTRARDESCDPSVMYNGFGGKEIVAGFINLEDREKQLIERERLALLEAINVIKKAAPMVII